MFQELRKAGPNPLDQMMTKAQVARRKFKSGLPRTYPNRALSKLDAMARTMQLFDAFRSAMFDEGADPNDVQAGLVYCQPETPGKKNIAAEVKALPKPEEIAKFAAEVEALHKPLFLGVLFCQQDREAEKEDKKTTFFVWPFMAGPEAEKRLIALRNQQAKGGFKKIDN